MVNLIRAWLQEFPSIAVSVIKHLRDRDQKGLSQKRQRCYMSVPFPKKNTHHLERTKPQVKRSSWKTNQMGKKTWEFSTINIINSTSSSGFLHRFLESSHRNPPPGSLSMACVSPSYSSTLRCNASRPARPPVWARWRKRQQCDKATGHAARPNNK